MSTNMKQTIFSMISGKTTGKVRMLLSITGMLFAVIITAILATASRASAVDANKEGKAAAEAELDLKEGKEYHAYFLFQAQNSWVYRGKFWEADKGPSGENWDKLLTTLNVTTPVVVDGTVEDAVIKGNGHYTIRLSGLNGSPSAGADNAEFGILGFSTDIPKNDTIQFDNVNVKIDGIDKGTVTGSDVYYDKDDITSPGLITVEVFNAWHEECKNLPLTLPNDSVEISFDVKGFQYDNPDATQQSNDSSMEQDDSSGKEDTAQTGDGKTEKNDDDTNNKGGIGMLRICIIVIIVALIAAGIVLILKKNKEK